MYDRILVPTDGSAGAEAAVERALDLAGRFDATVHALYVVDPTVAGGGFADDFGADTERVLDALRADGERAVAAVADAADAAGVDAVTAVRQGGPARTIREYARAEGCDCIVMSTRGRTGLGRFLLGSTTERVVRTADVPVLTVRRHAPPGG